MFEGILKCMQVRYLYVMMSHIEINRMAGMERSAMTFYAIGRYLRYIKTSSIEQFWDQQF